MLLRKDRENFWKVQKKQQTSKIYLLISFSGKRTWMETTYPPPAYPTNMFPTHTSRRLELSMSISDSLQPQKLYSRTESYACYDDETMHLNGCWSFFIRPKFILRNDICFGDWLPPRCFDQGDNFPPKSGQNKSPSILLWLFQMFLRILVQFNITTLDCFPVGGWTNPSEKICSSNWIIFPRFG